MEACVNLGISELGDRDLNSFLDTVESGEGAATSKSQGKCNSVSRS